MVRFARKRTFLDSSELEEPTPWELLKNQSCEIKFNDDFDNDDKFENCRELDKVQDEVLNQQKTEIKWADFGSNEKKEKIKIDNSNFKSKFSEALDDNDYSDLNTKFHKNDRIIKPAIRNLEIINLRPQNIQKVNSTSQWDVSFDNAPKSLALNSKILIDGKSTTNKYVNKLKLKKRDTEPSSKITYSVNNDQSFVKYDGFNIRREDVEKLNKLKQELINEGKSKKEIIITMKLARRRAEKTLARQKKKVCSCCRQSGHFQINCPELVKHQGEISEFCFKCGSQTHKHKECDVVNGDQYNFAICYICNEKGHVARQCNNNKHGIYPSGGGCYFCGENSHFKSNCPSRQKKGEKHKQDNYNDLNNTYVKIKNVKQKQKIVKF